MTSTVLTWDAYAHPLFEIVFDVNEGTARVAPPAPEVTIGSIRNADSITTSARAVMPVPVTVTGLGAW